MAPELVLVDTCIWIQFLNRPLSPEKLALDELLDRDRAALIGPIVAEVLQGIPYTAQADWVASTLRGVRYVEITWHHWRSAAEIGRRLAARRHQLPLSDLVIAAVALDEDVAVWTTDPHFDLIPDLRRFHPPRT